MHKLGTGFSHVCHFPVSAQEETQFPCPNITVIAGRSANGMGSRGGAIPLFALEAVAVDTETTGLDPLQARIVQLGALYIFGEKRVGEETFDRIVNPLIAIPPLASAVHGIDDGQATRAPSLKNVWRQWQEFTEGRIWIGHSIGFDIAVCEREAARYRLAFRRPRALDIGLLAQVVAPNLADHSLDGLAAWLGVEIVGRHQAIGDARAAALIFQALLPHLEARNIRTLAEAERACFRQTGEIRKQEEAGWSVEAAPVTERSGPGQRIDTYAYRHSVRTVMSSPIEVVPPTMTLKQAMDRMVANAISSVFIADPPKTGLPIEAYGILTERDAMRRISADGATAFDIPVGEICQKPVRTIREQAYVYRAIGRMGRLRFRHLGVSDDDGNLIGIVSARDLLRLRMGPAIALDDSIEIAQNARDLAVAWSSLPQVVNSLIAEEVEGWQVCRIVSEEIRSMTRRAAELARQAMCGDGHGDAPCDFAVMVLGSGGRGESMLVPDQDNAIIYSEGEPGSETDAWFREFATRMSDTLDKAGIPLCKGGVMAKNDEWRGSRARWRERVRQWVGKSRRQDLLNVDIFFDEMPVVGNLGLAQDLFRDAYEHGHEAVDFAKMLGENLPAPSSPFTWLGRLRPQDNRLDVKMHALFPIAATARALSIRHNLPVRSTRERLDALIENNLGGETDLDKLKQAHAQALAIVLESQATDITEGRKPSNVIDLARLSRRRKEELTEVLRATQILPTLVRDLMFASGK